MRNAHAGPLISIVTATFNSSKTLERTIKSVLPLLGSSVEFIVIDGGSTDGTVDIIQRHECYLAYWVSEPDRGVYDAWNKGIAAARGAFVSFIGSDDVVLPNYLNAYSCAVKAMPELEFISSRILVDDGRHLEVGGKWRWQDMRREMSVAHPGSLHSRDLFTRFGIFDVSYRIAGDYEFLLRVGPRLKAEFVEEVTVRFGPDGLSSTRPIEVAREVRRAKIANRTVGIVAANVECLRRVLVGFGVLLRRRFLPRSSLQ